MRSLFRRLVIEEEGQGITEYALILGLVVLGVWVAVNTSGLGAEINSLFTRVKDVVTGCTSGACGGSS
jgi:pilus assembly protein Flp/PilA